MRKRWIEIDNGIKISWYSWNWCWSMKLVFKMIEINRWVRYKYKNEKKKRKEVDMRIY